jgi:hypothetical protein
VKTVVQAIQNPGTAELTSAPMQVPNSKPSLDLEQKKKQDKQRWRDP